MMKSIFAMLLACCSITCIAQEEMDSSLKRCPVFITDTVSVNNFFLEFQPSNLKVYRVKGNLVVQVQQKDQFFTIFFKHKNLKNGKYKISRAASGKYGVMAKYSFRSGGAASFVNVSSGTIEASFDKLTDHWKLKVNGMLANLVERSVTYYKVRAELNLKD